MRKLWMAMLFIAVSCALNAQDKMQLSGVCPVEMDTVTVFDLSHGFVYAKIPVKEGKYATNLPVEKNALLGIGGRKFYIPFFADLEPMEVDLINRKVKASQLNEMTCRCDFSLDSLDQVVMGKMEELQNLAASGDEAFAKEQLADLMARRITQRIEIPEGWVFLKSQEEEPKGMGFIGGISGHTVLY